MGACVRTGGEHVLAWLGAEDDGRQVYRCGNCKAIGHSGPITMDEERADKPAAEQALIAGAASAEGS